MIISDNTQIFRDFSNLISHYFNRNYSSNTGKSQFFDNKIIPSDNNQIETNVNSIQVKISSLKQVLEISKFDYRIPQTRCYITIVQNEDFLIKIFQYFDNTFLFIEYYNLESHQEIEITSLDKQILIRYPELGNIKNTSYNLPVQPGSIIQIYCDTDSNITDLINYIEECIKNEISNHPLSTIQSQSIDYLTALDDAWAKNKYVHQKNRINITELLNTGINNLIWLQEIYIYFGWFDQVKLFYNTISKIDLDEPTLIIIHLCLSRYNKICMLLGQKTTDLGNLPHKKKNTTEDKYLDIYLHELDRDNSDIHEEIQNTWNYLHIPAIQLKLKNQIFTNPDEFIAFALLALRNHFWWYPKLEDILLKNLSDDKQAIFKFLSLINKSNNLYFVKESIHFSNYNVTSDVVGHNYVAGQYLLKITRQGRELYTLIKKSDSFSIKINKNIDVNYSYKTNTIHIKPNIRNPIIKQQQEIQLQISDYVILIPLSWNQFTIEFNNCRFKFLQKKARFQVTIKFDKQIKKIKINNEIIVDKNGLLQKYYIPIKHSKSYTHFSIYNESGGCAQKINPIMPWIILKGYGYNTFGILQTQFRVFLKNQKKSYEIDTSDVNEYPLTLASDKSELIMRADKFDPVNIKLDSIDPLILKLAYTHPAELYYRLKIYIDDQDKNIAEFNKVCHKNLGFIPEIISLSKIFPDKKNIILIISDVYINEKLKNNKEFRVIRINDKTKQTALWVSPIIIKDLFSEAFFNHLINKNKFDFS